MEKKLVLGNLDSYRDWGHSKDYVIAMHKILNHKIPDDFVIASGKTFSPQFLTITGGYSKAYTDRIRFGASIKLVNETIMQTSANGVAFDLGVQYTHSSLPLNLGIVLKNIGKIE